MCKLTRISNPFNYIEFTYLISETPVISSGFSRPSI